MASDDDDDDEEEEDALDDPAAEGEEEGGALGGGATGRASLEDLDEDDLDDFQLVRAIPISFCVQTSNPHIHMRPHPQTKHQFIFHLPHGGSCRRWKWSTRIRRHTYGARELLLPQRAATLAVS